MSRVWWVFFKGLVDRFKQETDVSAESPVTSRKEFLPVECFSYLCVYPHTAHVYAVVTRNYTAENQSGRLEGESDRRGLVVDSWAPAAICFICVRWQTLPYGSDRPIWLYIFTTSCHHHNSQEGEAYGCSEREKKRGRMGRVEPRCG